MNGGTGIQQPDVLTGQDGEVVFVPFEALETPSRAREKALAAGHNVAGFEWDVVEMLPIPEHFIGVIEDLGYSWSVVRGGTPDAVPFWRFRA